MVLKATSIMMSSQVGTTLILFARNVIVARLISVEDFGIASTFAILFAVIETLANMSVKKLLVQDLEGEDPQFQNTLQMVQVIRGVISAGLTLLLAEPFAAIMKTPDIVWAYQLLAVIPLARAFLHLDMFRLQRQMNFAPYATVITTSPVVGLATVWIAYQFTQDYQIMLWSIIVQQLCQVVLSHVFAKRRYGLAWNMTYVRRAISFGTPLLLNGILLVVITNGERMAVANQLDLVTLAWFSTAFLLATAPTRILTNTSSSLFLPKLSAKQDQKDAFHKLGLMALEVNLYLGLGMAVALSILGPVLIVGFFGARYAPGAEILVILGVAQAIRVARTGPNTVSMAAGTTSALLYMGMVRAMGLPAALWVLSLGYGVHAVAVVAVIGEAAAFTLGLWLNVKRRQLPLKQASRALMAFAAILALILVDVRFYPPTADILANFHELQLVLAAGTLLALLCMPHLWAWLKGLITQRGKRSPAE